MIDSVIRENIPVVWSTVVEEIYGDKIVTGVKVKNTKDEKMKEVKTDAVFVAIGEIPNSKLASEIGVKLDEYGYIIVDRYARTNILRIYTAGDVTGGVRQIVIAVGEGASAATAVIEDLSHS